MGVGGVAADTIGWRVVFIRARLVRYRSAGRNVRYRLVERDHGNFPSKMVRSSPVFTTTASASPSPSPLVVEGRTRGGPPVTVHVRGNFACPFAVFKKPRDHGSPVTPSRP